MGHQLKELLKQVSTDLILSNVARHIQLEDHEKDFFLSVLTHKKLRRRQYLLQEGDICRHENFVVKGCLRAYYIDEDGHEHILMFAVEDWWVGDLKSFNEEAPATLNIDALEESEVLRIDKQSMEILYQKVPKFERYFRIMLQNSIITSQNRVLQNIYMTAEERYLAFIQKYPRLESRLPQNQIASFLGITPEFLSKIRKKIAGENRNP